MSESMIVGVDHGYAAMKTAHFSFPSGLVAYEHEPYTLKDVLEYGGKFYVVGSGRQALQKNKTQTEDYYLLKVLVTPTWKIEGAVAKVEACNNGFDAVPTWEDITAMVQINRVYNFTNKTKTASKWGVNIRFTITKNEGFEGEVSISGFGGAYE